MVFYKVCIKPFCTIITKLIFKYRWQKNTSKYPYRPPPATNDNLLKMNDLPNLVWICASIFNFWLVLLITVETAKTSSGKMR